MGRHWHTHRHGSCQRKKGAAERLLCRRSGTCLGVSARDPWCLEGFQFPAGIWEHGKMSREFLTVPWDIGQMGRKRGACQRYGQERRTLAALPQWYAAGQDLSGREYAWGVMPERQLGWYRRISGPLGDGSPAFFMALLAWFHKRRISICAAYGYGL